MEKMLDQRKIPFDVQHFQSITTLSKDLFSRNVFFTFFSRLLKQQQFYYNVN